MKRKFFKTFVVAFIMMMLFSQSVFAETEVIETPNYTQVIIRPDPPKFSVTYKDGSIFDPECIYTGKEIKPEIVVKNQDGTIVPPSEYKVTYDEDCVKTGDHMINVEHLKTDFKHMMIYKIVPGLTTRVDMTAKDGKVTLSWAAVKGAVAYRVYKKNAEGRMVEVWLPNGEIAGEGLSRTFTDLEPGKTYEMGIMALDHIHSMPTDYLKTFKLTVPKSGEGNMNLVPGINPTTTQKTTKQTTVKVPVQKTTQKATTTLITTEATTVTTTALTETETETTTEQTTFIETIGSIETTSAKEEITESVTVEENSTEDNSEMNKTAILLGSVAAVVVVALIVVSVLIKKKK